MPYKTIMAPLKRRNVTLDDILSGEVSAEKFASYGGGTNTLTRHYEYLPMHGHDQQRQIDLLKEFNQRFGYLLQEDMSVYYDKFYIPKKSGGLREINAPNAELSTALRALKALFERDFNALYHTDAFAYIKGRSTVDAIKRHQANKSNWILKLDFSNFFGSTNLDFTMAMLSQISPFHQIMQYPAGREELKKALSLCFLNGGLPQGTPISPLLTNIIMIPIDFTLSTTLREYKDRYYIYTRYADDLMISCRKDFPPDQIENYVREVLQKFNAPFTIKKEKTRYGSKAGRNWNLGLMLNKDNNITVGHQKKKHFKTMLNNYILDRRNNKPWELHDIQVMSGQMSYISMVEKEYVEAIIEYFNQKYDIDLMSQIKEDLNEQ